jgi:hypothetical protein
MNLAFQEWPKIYRLYRDVLITEKIDGTNACIAIVPVDEILTRGYEQTDTFNRPRDGECVGGKMDQSERHAPGIVLDGHVIFAQSRKKVISPGSDNFGFAAFVRANATELLERLGPGRHYGEWYGGGIQHGYNMQKNDKRFALFNASRWQFETLPERVNTVPILYEGVFSDTCVQDALAKLRPCSWAKGSSGMAKAEGVVVYFKQSRTSFKVLAEDDDVPKTVAASRTLTQPKQESGVIRALRIAEVARSRPTGSRHG